MARHGRLYLALAALLLLLATHHFIQPFTSSHTYTNDLQSPASERFASRPPLRAPVRQTSHSGPRPASSHADHGLSEPTETQYGVKVDRKGLMSWDPTTQAEGAGKHPIKLLIERGAKLAQVIEEKLAGIKSVKDAAEDYRGAFGMRPPRGFDAWYAFTQLTPTPHPPTAPSLLPLVHTPILPYLSHPAPLLRSRVANARDTDGPVYTLTFVPDGEGDVGTACKAGEDWVPEDWWERGKGRVRVQGESAWDWRSNNTLSLLIPILPYLPAELFTQDPPLEMAFSIEDGPAGMVHDTFREKSKALAKAGRTWPEMQLTQAEQSMRWTYGWAWSCPENAPLKTLSTDTVLNDVKLKDDASSSASEPRTYVADFDKAVDFCQNPDLMGLHHVLLADEHRAAVNLVPVVAMCGTAWNSDIVGVPLDGVYERVPYVPWEKKDVSKIFWRGTATGLFHDKRKPWRSSQRERLHFWATNTTGTVPLLLPDGTVRDWERGEVVEGWLDVGLSGGATQCNIEDGTCDEMNEVIQFKERVKKEASGRYKYAIDVDGNGWSSRFRRLLSGNNVVFKSTVYVEWFNTLLIPWYHYIPVKPDYSDIFDILAFFEGSPGGSIPGHDDLARDIAANAREFTEDQWRHEDMQSFMFLLILEYWRMMSDDRESASYAG
ncbi:hypothetical protein IAT38_000203 [Cryptococcus sp. DSM 104549]